MNPGGTTASVVVVTYKRPDHVRTCLQHIAGQSVLPLETVVVDASPDDETYEVVDGEFPAVRYLRNPFGAGSMATSREIGLRAVRADVVVFIDDDAYARDEWLSELLVPYADPAVGGVGGRAARGRPGEEHEGAGQIGMFLPNGALTGNFAADPGYPIDVDHLPGTNMSYRRDVLIDLGGIHDSYPGTCLREDSDIALRVRQAGYRLIYNPRSCVDHVVGPYATGHRFDLRYTYYGQRNHVVLLTRVVGRRAPQFRRYLGVGARGALAELGRAARGLRDLPEQGVAATARTAADGTVRAAAIGGGLACGLVAGRRGPRSTGGRR